MLYGSETQKQSLLRKMATGNVKAVVCQYDNPEGLSIADKVTKATQHPEKNDQYIISGRKVLVPADPVDFYFILARTPVGSALL